MSINANDIVTHLIKLREGDRISFRIIYEQHVSSLYGFVYKLVKSSALSDDIVQEVFIKIWETRDQIDVSKSFNSYLHRIAKNQVINIFTRARTEESVLSEILKGAHQIYNFTEQELYFQKTSDILQEGIAQLPSQQRKIFELCKTEGLTYEQAAERLNLSTSTINTQMVNSLRFLRKYLASKGNIAGTLLALLHL